MKISHQLQLLIFAVISLSVSSFYEFCPNQSHRLRGLTLRLSYNDLEGREDVKELWRVRRKMVRSVASPLVKSLVEKAKTKIATGQEEKGLDLVTLATIGLLASSVAIFRFGGRAAFISFLGLDFVADADLKTKLDDFVHFASGLGSVNEYALFLLLWIVVKTLCLDALTIILAVSSGIIFGGFWQGTIASVLSSTIASSINFQIARQFFGDNVKSYIQSRSSLRNLDRACSKDGFKTVLTLRLSPLLPIPIAAYSYLYGATSIAFPDFVFGLSLGSVKPYAFDCYLGLFGQGVLNNDSSQSDPLILVALIAVVGVGLLATQLASSFYAEIGGVEPEAPEEGSISDDIYNTLARFLGWQERTSTSEESDPTRGLFGGARRDFSLAWERVSAVVDDEVSVVSQEIRTGAEVSANEVDWSGKLLYRGVLDDQRNDIGTLDGDGQQQRSSRYPGFRKLAAYEEGDLDGVDNVLSLLSFESLVFSLVVFRRLVSLETTNGV
jgi:uncharacterized membrane protein YdjX (TVP38/TMEM64 family)